MHKFFSPQGQSGQDYKCVELYLHSLIPLQTEDGLGMSWTLHFYHRWREC